MHYRFLMNNATLSLLLRCDDCGMVIRYRCDGCGSFACVNDDCTGARETAVCGCEEEQCTVTAKVA
jgi:hypothetical protein